MSEPIISVESLGKRYRLGASRSGERYTALRDVIADRARSIFRNPRSAIRNASEADASDFWALKDVSFEVKQGEVLGIIGRNGAGKSTLLKILSRITEPTEGRIKIKGRVASLLEVGTGFHPELTGCENIFLNGAILGMHRSEIKAKFDEIVAFAEVEKFLDTPVKRYSSGMYVRLAFAVAAHLEPEILVVDEVLAVGDAEFQKKCLGKMSEVALGGRTVLFVSHNIGALSTLCGSGLVLDAGTIRYHGEIAPAVKTYSETRKHGGDDLFPKQLSAELTLAEFSMSPNPVRSGERLSYSLILQSTMACRVEGLAILFYSSQGFRVGIIDLRTVEDNLNVSPSSPLKIVGGVILPALVDNDYSIGLFIYCPLLAENLLDLLQLRVTRNSDPGSPVPYPASARGIIDLSANITLRQ